MNGKTAKLIRKVAKSRGNRTPRYIRGLKRLWYSLTTDQRAEKRIELKQEIGE